MSEFSGNPSSSVYAIIFLIIVFFVFLLYIDHINSHKKAEEGTNS